VGPKKKGRGRYHHGDLRSALLEVAVEAIGEHGLSGLSLRDCARRLGVSHAAPYRHFVDKDALLMAIAGDGFAMLVDAGRAAMEGLDDPRDRLDAYGVAYVRFAMDHPEHHRVMFTSEIGEDAVPKGAIVTSTASFELLLECASAVVGVPKEEATVPALAFWSLVHGLSMLILDGRIPPEHIATEDQVDALTRAAFHHWRQTA